MQQGFAVRRRLHEHFAMIVLSMPALQGVLVDETIYKFYSAVMAQAELLRESGNSGTSALGQALDRQEKLMLLRFDALGASGSFAKTQELPDTVPELSKPAKPASETSDSSASARWPSSPGTIGEDLLSSSVSL